MYKTRWLTSLTLCLCMLVGLSACNSSSPVLVDPSHRSLFADGWGTSLAWWANEVGGWPPDAQNKIITMLFAPPPAGLGLTIARYNIGAGTTADPQRPISCPALRLGGEVPTFEKYDGSWNWNADHNQRTILQAAKVASGNSFVAEAFANSPPAWMTESGCTSGNRPKQECSFSFSFININCKDVGENLSKAYYEKYADYLSKVVQYYNTSLEIPFRTVEPFNESNPQDGGFNWPNGCTSRCQEGANFLPQTQNTIIALLCKKLAGTATTVSAPDENSIDTTKKTYEQYDSRTRACISQLNTHSYNGTDRSGLFDLAQRDQKRLWMSEYTTNDPLTLAKQIATDLNGMHPAAWIYWQAVESFEQGGGYGLLHVPFCSPKNSDNTIESLNQSVCPQMSNPTSQVGGACNAQTAYCVAPTEQYSVMANYSMFVRPGDYLLDSPDPAHLLEAFNPSTHTLVLVETNDQGSSQPLTFDLSHFTRVTGPVQVYTTSQDKQVYTTSQDKQVYRENLSSPTELRNQQLSTTLDANSVTTFVINGAYVGTPSPATSLRGVDWTKVITATELGCNGPTAPNLGVQVDAKQFADVTGDNNAEAFVAVACVGSTESWPDRLEVFDGASDPAHPRRIATLLDYQDGTDGTNGYGLRIQSITISGKMVTVVSRGWTPGECFACGDQRVTDTFTWNGSSFTRGSRSVTQIT